MLWCRCLQSRFAEGLLAEHTHRASIAEGGKIPCWCQPGHRPCNEGFVMPGMGIKRATQLYFESHHGHGVVDAFGFQPGQSLRREVPHLPPGAPPPQGAEDCFEWCKTRSE